METISVAQLRQNPTAALDAVQQGESFTVTKHQRPIARLVPVDSGEAISPAAAFAKKRGTTKLADAVGPPRMTVEETMAILDELRDEE
ncbi:type II toxin-antitoxin system Phd/YefM family antitoxin [Galactobacter sp.]|uniref:type II toxin-antitoxin system Phd/YefM family antitoxin n=1 Tax=Galactobacter sp. TaxID=2676125 RepID=UPI0025C5E3EB|nr:type II toxin-antitoxin system prevent-host-death family antitoxin [Galactobacter sp.]